MNRRESPSQASAARQIESFLAKYSLPVAKQLSAARAKLRALFPTGYELVYDNYNALVFGFGPTARASDAVVSIAGYPEWVRLFFLRGAFLEDPQDLLEGAGAQVRSIRLASPHDIDRREIVALIRQAKEVHRAGFSTAAPLSTVVKSVSRKQRPRQSAVKTRGKRPSSQRLGCR